MSQPRIPLPPATAPGRTSAGRFAPGTAGNPGGRPKSVGEVRRPAREQTELAIRTLVEVATNPNETGAARVAACVVLLDRGYGKAVQPVALGDAGQFDQFTDDELDVYVMDRARQLLEGANDD
jgi:hypothetical protein